MCCAGFAYFCFLKSWSFSLPYLTLCTPLQPTPYFISAYSPYLLLSLLRRRPLPSPFCHLYYDKMTKESQPKSQNASSFTNKSPLTYILTQPHPFWGQRGKVDWNVKDPGGLEEGKEWGGDRRDITPLPLKGRWRRKRRKRKRKRTRINRTGRVREWDSTHSWER